MFKIHNKMIALVHLNRDKIISWHRYSKLQLAMLTEVFFCINICLYLWYQLILEFFSIPVNTEICKTGQYQQENDFHSIGFRWEQRNVKLIEFLIRGPRKSQYCF